MKKIRLFSRKIPWIFLMTGWVAILLAACSPASGTASSGQPVIAPSLTLAAATPTLDASIQESPRPTEAAPASPIPVVTSRGPELHASDPATVSLASGGLQLVEFFRFT